MLFKILNFNDAFIFISTMTRCDRRGGGDLANQPRSRKGTGKKKREGWRRRQLLALALHNSDGCEIVKEKFRHYKHEM